MATNEELMWIDLRLDEHIKYVKDHILKIASVNTILTTLDLWFFWRRLQLKQKCILLILKDRGVL